MTRTLAAVLGGFFVALASPAFGQDPPQYMTGARPSTPQVLASAARFVQDGKIGAPAQYARIPDRIHVWANNRYGCCVTSEEAAAKIAAHPNVFISEAEVVEWARRNRVLNGATLSEVLEEMCNRGLLAEDGTRYQNGRPLLVDYRDKATLADALYKGPVKIAVSSGQIMNSLNQNRGRSGWAGTDWRLDDRTDHCVGLFGYGPAEYLYGELTKKFPEARMPQGVRPDSYGYLMFTWGTIGFVSEQSLQAVCREAWYREPTTAGFPEPAPKPPEPKPGPTPGPEPKPGPCPDGKCPVPRWVVMLITAGVLVGLAVLPMIFRGALRSLVAALPKKAAVVLAGLVAGGSALAGPVPCEVQATLGKPEQPAKYDPYRAKSYREFHDTIVRLGSWYAKNGVTGKGMAGSGVLYVGVPDASVGTYELHYRVESGFGGMADGVYDCWYDMDKCDMVGERRATLPAARPDTSAEGWYWYLSPPIQVYPSQSYHPSPSSQQRMYFGGS